MPGLYDLSCSNNGMVLETKLVKETGEFPPPKGILTQTLLRQVKTQILNK